MATVKIKAHVGREVDEPPTLPHLLLLLSGVCAMLLPALDGLQYSALRAILFAAALGALLWMSARIGSRWAVLSCLLCATLWCLAGVAFQDALSAQMAGAFRILFTGSADAGNVSFDLAALMCATFLVLLFFTTELLLGSHVIPYGLTMIFFLIGPLFGLEPSLEAMMLALLFQFSYWTMNGSGMRQSRFDFALPSRARLTALMGGVMAVILVVVLLLATPVASRNTEAIYEPAYAAEGFLRRAVSRLTGIDSEPVTGGRFSRGNNYPTGSVHLILNADRKPSETVYLRGFHGDSYDYNGWDYDVNVDLSIFRNMAAEYQARWENERRFQALKSTGQLYREFERLYWNWNYLSRLEADGEPGGIRMTVQRSGDGGRERRYCKDYAPYYSAWDVGALVGGDPLPGADSETPAVHFYESSEMNVNWNVGSDARDAQWMEADYQKQIQRVYTYVPTDRLPRLTQLCREHPLSDIDEITAFIVHTLQSRASYSLTPGWTPFNRDMVEYFLFDNGLGYCQHFASAAVLMYRLYGIPARYATGYAATPDQFMNTREIVWSGAPSDFVPKEGDNYFAVMTDADAHAWPEIFLPGYGWTPVEVTPAADGSMMTNYPGLNLELFAQRLADWNITLPTMGRRSAASAPRSLVASFAARMDRNVLTAFRSGVRAALTASPLIAAAALYSNRKRRLRRDASADCRVSFGRLLSMLHFAGLLSDCDGQEPDFAARLSSAVPAIAEPDAVRLCRIAEAAAYGPDKASEEDNAFSRRICRQTAAALSQTLNFWKRLAFRWRYA